MTERIDASGEPINPTDSAVLRNRFGKNWRSWKWFRDQWTKLSVTVVSGLATILGGFVLWNVHLGTKVTVLETVVVPDQQVRADVEALKHDRDSERDARKLLEGRVKTIEDSYIVMDKESKLLQRPHRHYEPK